MPEEESLIDAAYLLHKFPGKGGWTYAEITEIKPNRKNPFGWVRVSGFIDNWELKQYKLMPMGNGKLFLPVKAAIRKNIGKEAGDTVHVKLYPDETPLEIPNEILDCFMHEAKHLLTTFSKFTEGEQKAYLDWIYDAKTENTKARRIVEMMERLERELKFYD
jgi:hypothetical protein